MEFHISGSVNGESKSLAIIGRRGDEPIAPAAEFLAMIRIKPSRYPDELELPREIEVCKSIRIKVEELEAHDKKLSLLPANSTGILGCADSSDDSGAPGWILTDRCISASD